MRTELLIAALALLARGTIAQDTNLLANPGFEEWAEAGPAGWGSNATPLLRTDDAHSGAAALRIDAGAETNRADAFQLQKTDLRPDTRYRASIWAKGRGRFRIQLSQYNPGWVGGCSMLHVDLTDEWTEYPFFYGVVGDEVKSIRFDLYLDGVGAWAVIDDASFAEIGPVQPPGANLVPNGDMSADADADGVPDRWALGNPVGEADRALAVGPDGSPALTVPCTPQPGAGPDLARWWDWSAQPPPAVGWINAAASETFAVEPGRTYEVSFQLRGQDVRTYHTKLFWLDAEGRTVKWSAIGPRHDGSWAWEQVDYAVTVPSAGVAAARLEFWAMAAGGRLWVDSVSFRPSYGRALGWVEERYEVTMLDGGAATAANAGAVPQRPAAPPFTPTATPTAVRVSAGGLEITLSSGVRLLMPIADARLLGITEVSCDGRPLRNPDAPPIAPLVETDTGGHYLACRYLDHEVRGEEVIVRTALMREGGEDRLEWHFRPEAREIAGESYAGYAYRYRWQSDTERALNIADRSTWEVNGDPLGVTVVTQNAYAVQNQFTLTAENLYAGGGGTRFAGGDGLDYQYASDGAILSFYAEPISYVDSRRAGHTGYIECRDVTPFAGDPEATTAWRCVLYAPTGSHDAWTRARDYAYDLHARFWGIDQPTPLPIVNAWMHWRLLSEHGDRILYYFADEVVPQVAALGFKVFAVHSVWGRGGCGLDVIEPGAQFGGTEALKYLCDAAAAHGMIVQAWAPTAHLWQHSPLFEQNQGWHIEGPNGQPPTTYCWPEIRGARFRMGYADYALGQWRTIREQTGLGALWLDSYRNFTHGIQTADRAVLLQQSEDLFRFHADLARLGYVLYTESTGTFGINAPGFPVANADTPSPAGPDPATRYGVSGYVGHEGDERRDRAVNDVITGGDYYYRSLANKSPCWLSWPTFAQTPERHAKIARANRDYVTVVGHMRLRTTLPEDRGVQWTDPAGGVRVLFSFAAGRHECPGATQVTDITTGRPVTITGAAFDAEPTHTYLIRGEE